MANIYCTATNTGTGFITHAEQENEQPLNAKGFPGNVWIVNDNATGRNWLTKVNGVSKTKAEAQAIVDAEIQSAQATWDALPEDSYEKQFPLQRPMAITLP